MDSYRVFISYSHKDLELVKKLVTILEENGVTPLWDRNFALGRGFHEQIQTFIAHAHVFMPVITASSSKRGWVHQEIGYAMALNVPVLPVTLDTLPGEMIEQLQALSLEGSLDNAKKLLTYEMFENLVDTHSDPKYALYQCAEQAEERAVIMAQYANNVSKLGQYGCVRQKGGLSSFHIPDKVISHPIWRQRYGSIPKSDYHCKCQFNERLALEKHARAAGCKLIINPGIISESYRKDTQIARYGTLVEFLESMPDDKVQIVLNEQMRSEESVTLVGDWFLAEAVARSVQQGYRQTNFTRHAPSMSARVRLFDREMDELLQKNGWSPETSRVKAIQRLKELMEELGS